MEPDWVGLGARLTEARGDLKAAAVAREVGLSGTQLRNYERGLAKSGRPSAERIIALADYYRVDPEPWLALVGYKVPRRAALDKTLSVPPAIVPLAAAGAVGEQGRLMPEERAEIVGALASIGQQLLDLAQRIEAAGRDERS